MKGDGVGPGCRLHVVHAAQQRRLVGMGLRDLAGLGDVIPVVHDPELRTGQVHINGASADFTAPFGGYKRSGNGREWGRFGLDEFLEVKAIMGYAAAE